MSVAPHSGGFTLLQNVTGWRADQHRIWCTVRGATGVPAGGSYGPIDAVRNGARVDDRDIHACYWLSDGTVHAVSSFTDGDGVLWWPQVVRDIDPWSGRLLVECVADDWAQARVDAEPHWPASYSGPKWLTVWLVVPEISQPADFNGDGLVDTKDFTAFLNMWNAARDTR